MFNVDKYLELCDLAKKYLELYYIPVIVAREKDCFGKYEMYRYTIASDWLPFSFKKWTNNLLILRRANKINPNAEAMIEGVHKAQDDLTKDLGYPVKIDLNINYNYEME
jgi:hypothetical protein